MKKLRGVCLVMIMTLLTGCSVDRYMNNGNAEISYEPVVCRYTTMPTCWTVLDFISTNIKVNADNTVEVYCGDFHDRVYDEDVIVEYIYGETFEISEEQKQEIIDSIEKNKRGLLKENGEEESCDGSMSYIVLFDKNGEVLHNCGGLNPCGKSYEQVKDVIFSVLPEGTTKDIKRKSTEILIDYLLENYPEEYDWLAEER